ncbi:hypothetical protein EDD11_001906 [Mortierella claussenii]|nr:hypothetical protein EDD11_001906 [Mortierella claussenii]
MVQLTLPLLDNLDNEPDSATNKSNPLPNCDPSQSIYDARSCIKDFLFCSDDNPCPSKLPCIDRVCQCLPNSGNSYITLTPPPVRMYTIGCNFDTTRTFDSCRQYEYSVGNTCLLNYCSAEVPCYAGTCDMNRHVCTNITSTTKPLPVSQNGLITLGNDPFGTHKEGFNPVLIILMAAGGLAALALLGCIVRTTTSWTKSSVRWASGGNKDSSSDDQDDSDEKYHNGKGAAVDRGVKSGSKGENDSFVSGDSINAMARKPSKFTGHHYMPSPQLGPASNAHHAAAMFHNSNDSSISPFASPLPSPHFSPYSQPNHSQVSDHSLLNPFRQGASGGHGTSGMAIELSNRTATPSTGSSESLQTDSGAGAVAGTGAAVQENRATAGTLGGPGGAPLDPRMSRSQSTLSRDGGSGIGAGGGGPGGFNRSSGLHKSMSMQQLGSRPAPPPPPSARAGAGAGSTYHSASLVYPGPSGQGPINRNNSLSPPPTIAVSMPAPSHAASKPSRQSSMIMQGPSLSLNSLIQQHPAVHESGSDSPIIMRSLPLPLPVSSPPESSSSTTLIGGDIVSRTPTQPFMPTLQTSNPDRASLVLQSVAERHPSLTVPAHQSMLRHSASVPQMFGPTDDGGEQQQQQHPDRRSGVSMNAGFGNGHESVLIEQGSYPSSPPPSQRRLPAGFASSPVASSVGRFNSNN